jgi:hypothetical protein
MKVFIRLGVFTALIVLAFSSCATIVAGGSPKITIDGDRNEPVTIITEKQIYENVELPTQVKVNRHKIDGQRVQIKSENYNYRDIYLDKAINGWTFGNILIGGLIGWGVDLGTNCVSKPSKKVYYIEGTPKAPKAPQAPAASVAPKPTGHYVSILSKVEKPANPDVRYGETTVIKDSLSKYRYEDNIIDITIYGNSRQFSFVLKNVSDNSIKIIWNDAAFVDYDGKTSKIMHSGIKYSERESNQVATTIIKGARLDDLVIPNCNVKYNEALNGWITESMYPSVDGKSPGQLCLMLPIQIKDVINEYLFVFDVQYVFD